MPGPTRRVAIIALNADGIRYGVRASIAPPSIRLLMNRVNMR